ncbi:hypothetical protein [Thiothrix subterranea]|uniref:Lipoprotein n=1 Tax=Thiothrix subterranea TaxID=2735563 RepID=A0AA51MPK2_9GAMM|nr:hypothetical protein [Thiothrix subterranea]MDQ5770722.1 hypothetical protein [Thiothrix subterranea]WML87720.1 hypothetical protein RCG00_04980 [Thiothrix subterranea]
MNFFRTVFLSIFLAFIMVTGCVFQPPNRQPTTEPYDICKDEKNVMNEHISMINKYKNDNDFSIEKTRGLIKLLSNGFNIDSGECMGFTESVKSAAKDLFSTKRHLFVNPLREICSQDVSISSHNLVDLNAQINEIKTSTSILQDIILVDTNNCTQIP